MARLAKRAIGPMLPVALAVATGCSPSLSDVDPSGGGSSTADAAAEGGALDSAATDGPPGDTGGGEVGADASAGGGPTAPELAGSWAGTSSLGRPITFEVDPAGLVGWDFGWRLPDCESAHVATFPPVPIAGGGVTKSTPGAPGALAVTMTIRFSSTAAASGAVEFVLAQSVAGGCFGAGEATFTAARATPGPTPP